MTRAELQRVADCQKAQGRAARNTAAELRQAAAKYDREADHHFASAAIWEAEIDAMPETNNQPT